MRVLYLDIRCTIILDVLAWVLFHLGIGYLSSRIPHDHFDPNKRFYKSFSWEKGGKIYEKFFRVRTWKKLIPDGSALYPNTFSIRRLPTYKVEYLRRWLVESCRAEFCHWMMMIPGAFFFLWNGVSTNVLMIMYAILNNIVPIVAQRYNRPRMRRMLEHYNAMSPQMELVPIQR